MASPPNENSAKSGCTFLRIVPPVVEYLTCPTAAFPVSRSMTSGDENVSPTSPRLRWVWKCPLSWLTIPADSCPRCWRACRPKAVCAEASTCPSTANTPQPSRGRLSLRGRAGRTSPAISPPENSGSLWSPLHISSRRAVPLYPDSGEESRTNPGPSSKPAGARSRRWPHGSLRVVFSRVHAEIPAGIGASSTRRFAPVSTAGRLLAP